MQLPEENVPVPSPVTIDATRFRDAQGRHVILRGVNLGGDCKLPAGSEKATHMPTDFADHRDVSFVGRPAPLDELDAHLARLVHWGFNSLRLLTSWEAVEHTGPGLYDEAYLDYLTEVCARAGRHGLRVFIDFHQDVWSRMSGGDGAPGWTWEAAGLDFTRFHIADAALVMQYNYDPAMGGRQPSYPTMSWPSNYAAPANGIIWTMFFAGETFAPTARVGDENIQTYLQRHYFGAVRAVAERVADMDHVIGFDTLNEPGVGFIGKAFDRRDAGLGGLAWSPLDALAASSGISRELPLVELGKGEVGTRRVNANRVSIWLPGRADPFLDADAWGCDDTGEPVALKPDYFTHKDGREIDPERDFFAPFFARVADTIRSIRSDWLVFAEINPFDAAMGRGFPEGTPERAVNASHWYDFAILATKTFDVAASTNPLSGKQRLGRRALEEDYVSELTMIKAAGDKLNGGAPTLIGECGIPFDMNNGEAYARWARGERTADIWTGHVTALDLMYNAFDRLLLSSTLWNYTVSNANDPMLGDGWNQEDLSIWSSNQATYPEDPDSGGRAVPGFCRPYVQAAQGELLSQRFDSRDCSFAATVLVDLDAGPTEIFLPRRLYGTAPEVTAGSATVSYSGQIITLMARESGPLEIYVDYQAGAATKDKTYGN